MYGFIGPPCTNMHELLSYFCSRTIAAGLTTTCNFHSNINHYIALQFNSTNRS